MKVLEEHVLLLAKDRGKQRVYVCERVRGYGGGAIDVELIISG